jgi:hypothetical protein
LLIGQELQEAGMTAISSHEYRSRRSIESFGQHYYEASDGLLVVALWSIIGLAFATLAIWLGLGGQLEPLLGLG